MISSISYLIRITEDMANATRLYANLAEAKLNTRKFTESPEAIQDVNLFHLSLSSTRSIR